MSAGIALVVVAAALAWALVPILSAAGGGEQLRDARASELQSERANLLEALRDIDMDLAMGKVSETDHAEMKSSLESQALRVLADIEAHAASPSGGEDAGG